MAIYRHAEESREAMKVAVDTKEEQLHHAMQQIDAMQALHQRLVEQSRVLTGTFKLKECVLKKDLHLCTT